MIEKLFSSLRHYLNFQRDDERISSGFVVHNGVDDDGTPTEWWDASWSIFDPDKEDTDLTVLDNHTDRYSMLTESIGALDLILSQVTQEFDSVQRHSNARALHRTTERMIDEQLTTWFDTIDSVLASNLAYTELSAKLRRYYLTVDYGFTETLIKGLPLPVIFRDPSTFFKACLAKTLVYVDKVNQRIEEYNTMIERFGIAQFTVLCRYVPEGGFYIELHAMLDTEASELPTDVEDDVAPTSDNFEEEREALRDFQPPRDFQEVSRRKQECLLNLPNQEYFQASIIVHVLDRRAEKFAAPYLREHRQDLLYNYRGEYLLEVLLLFATGERGVSLYNHFKKVMENYSRLTYKSTPPHSGYGNVFYSFMEDANMDFLRDNRRSDSPLLERQFEANLTHGLERFFLELFEKPMIFTRYVRDASKRYKIDEISANDAVPPVDINSNIKIGGFYYSPERTIPVGENSGQAEPPEYYKNYARVWTIRRKQRDQEQVIRANNFSPSAYPREKYLPSTANFAYRLALGCPVQLEHSYVPELLVWDVSTMKPFDRTLYQE